MESLPTNPPNGGSDSIWGSIADNHADWLVQSQNLRTKAAIDPDNIHNDTFVTAVPVQFQQDGSIRVIHNAEVVLVLQALKPPVRGTLRIWFAKDLSKLNKIAPRLLWSANTNAEKGRCVRCKAVSKLANLVCTRQGCGAALTPTEH